MSSTFSRRTGAAAAIAAALLFSAPAAGAAPAYDSQGYLDSTASCTSPDTVVVFGSTAGSRVAICRDVDGGYEYRGVRVRDGARLIKPATQSADGAFTATNDGVDYMVTSRALVVSVGEKVIRDEPMVDFHRAGSSSSSTDSQSEGLESTPTMPLPPPLPAEVGGDEG